MEKSIIMDTSKFIEILRITAPVFATLALGNILSRMGKMTDSHQAFLNWLVYYISLPALIFVGMATQPISSLLSPEIVLGTLFPMLAMFVIAILVTLVLRFDRKTAIVVIFGTYWSNVAYMGFPLTDSAFGATGFLCAAIVNAVSMPILIAMTFVMLGFCSDKKQSVGASLWSALANPIILASIAGILFAWAADAMRGAGISPPVAVAETFGICEIILRNVGTMGLTLALLAIGGRLRFRAIGKNAFPVSIAVVGKLVVLPLMALLMMRWFWPGAERDIAGATVLLMTMPTAVTGAVIAAQFKLDEDLVSSTIVICMVAGVVMIPVWLYVVL